MARSRPFSLLRLSTAAGLSRFASRTWRRSRSLIRLNSAFLLRLAPIACRGGHGRTGDLVHHALESFEQRLEGRHRYPGVLPRVPEQERGAVASVKMPAQNSKDLFNRDDLRCR